MTRTSYSGDIDWNRVYRRYYQLDQIEDRLERLLIVPSDVLFCGFAEIASRLSSRHTVHFMEYSDAVAEAARREFPTIARTSRGNILDAIGLETSPVVMVVCRISAYWQTEDCLQRFFSGIRATSRELVVVDFFDADRLEGGRVLGNIEFSNIRRLASVPGGMACEEQRPTVLLAQVQGSYPLADDVNAFVETRAFYRQQELVDYANKLLPDYDVSVEPPIVEKDPGFTLVIRRTKLATS